MREYGQGSYSQKKTKRDSNNRSFKKVVSYYFDNSLSKSSNFVVYVILLSFVLGLLMTFLKDFLALNSSDIFYENWWINVSEILELGKGESWPDRLVEFIFWVISIAITGVVIGFLSSKISLLFQKLSRGKSFIIDTNHILVLGWSNNLFAILKELDIANLSEGKQKVVIFADIPNDKMQEDLMLIKPSLKSIEILTRSGDPTNPSEIVIANPNAAKSIIILNNEQLKDPYVVTTTLSVCSVLENKQTPIVSSVKMEYFFDSLSNISSFNIIPVKPDNVIANVTAQALRQRGLGLVVLDFLDFDGDEIYFKHIPELIGEKYIDSILSFQKSSVIGVSNSKNEIMLGVEKDYILKSDDQLIFVSEDDSTIKFETNKMSFKDTTVNINDNSKLSQKNIIFVGWSSLGVQILNSINGFLTENSKIAVLYDEKYVNSSTIDVKYSFDIDFISTSNNSKKLEEILKTTEFDDLVILGYTDKLSINEADTLTLLKNLEIDSLIQKNGYDLRVMTQILNSNKSKLTEITSVKEIIISDNLCALLISQLSENPNLSKVFDTLFDPESTSINIFPIDNYVKLEQKISYSEVAYKAAFNNHSAIGLLLSSTDLSSQSEGLILNPTKTYEFTPRSGDSLIVISK